MNTRMGNQLFVHMHIMKLAPLQTSLFLKTTFAALLQPPQGALMAPLLEV